MLDEMFIRPIEPGDDAAVANVLRTVMMTFDLDREGSALRDPEVSSMSSAYSSDGSAYFVAELNGKLVAGCGIGPLEGGEPGVCELRKMYVLAEARGRGIGRRLLQSSLERAKSLGYHTCYLETLAEMTDAARLYERAGFKKSCGSMGNTGHSACDTRYVKEL